LVLAALTTTSRRLTSVPLRFFSHRLYGRGKPDEFTVRVPTKPEQIKELLAVGFEYVCLKDSMIFLRKRK
jgi:hypothetical protein